MVSPKDHLSRSPVEQKIISKDRLNRLNESSVQMNTNMMDEEESDPLWTSSGT